MSTRSAFRFTAPLFGEADPPGGEESRRSGAYRVERALTGRLLLLPAIAYEGGDREAFRAYLGNVLAELARSAFHHLVIVVPEDLAEAAEARGKIAVHPLPSRNEATEEEIEEWAEALRERIVRLWQGADDENASDEES